MALLASERPGLYWNQLEIFLREAGIYSSEHVLLADPTVLALVGNMGPQQAVVLRNYAKRIILPLLGLRGTYQEDEDNDDTEFTSNPPTGKRLRDVGEAVLHGFYKKRKLENNEPKSIDRIDLTLNEPVDDFDSYIDFDENEDTEYEGDELDTDDELDPENDKGKETVDEL
jgi:hypothetical protein